MQRSNVVHVAGYGADRVFLKSVADRMLKINQLNSMTADLAVRFMESF